MRVDKQDRTDEINLPAADQPGESKSMAWEEVSSGRYMPRRIKGSCKGRALG
jgi:hypothetical protein